MKDDLTLLFVGCDGYTAFSNLAVAHFKYWDIPKVHCSHTEPLNRPDVKDVLTSGCMGPPTEKLPLGRDLLIPRLLRVLREEVKTPYVFWVMSDHFYPAIDINMFGEWIECMKKFNVFSLQCSEHGIVPDDAGSDVVWSSPQTGTVKWAYQSMYVVSHHSTLFRVDFLIDTLQSVLDTGGQSGYDHEIAYYIHGGYNRNKTETVKQKNDDERPLRCAYVVEPRVTVMSALGNGNLHEKEYHYIQSCSFPEAEQLKGFKIGEFCPRKTL